MAIKEEGKGISQKEIIILAILSVLYLSWFYFAVELRWEHPVILIALLSAYLYGGKMRKAIIGFSPFVFYLSAYDSLRAFPNYMYNTLHIEDLYLMEKNLFGINFQNQLMTLNEYFFHHQNTFFDAISGVCYLTWVPVPFAFAIYLFVTGKKKIFINFSLLFVLANLLGFIGYFIYPAAPPWYVEMHGFEFKADTLGEATRLSNFDRLVGMPIFEGLYSKNANVFAAVPSIHAANPFTVFLASLQLKNRPLQILFFLITAGMWFGAVYGNHHYVFDVLCGAFVVLLAYVIVYFLLRKTSLNKYLVKFEEAIS